MPNAMRSSLEQEAKNVSQQRTSTATRGTAAHGERKRRSFPLGSSLGDGCQAVPKAPTGSHEHY